MTDLHLANQRNDVATFSSEYMDRIRKEVKDLEAKGYTVFSFHLGDGSWDEFWYVNDFLFRVCATHSTASHIRFLYIQHHGQPR